MALASLWVLLLSVKLSWTASITPVPAQDVISVLQARGNFKTLLSYIAKAGLTDTLKSAPALTLFAPNDDAFSSLPVSTLQIWQSDSNVIKSILNYHTVPQKYQIHGSKYQEKTLPSMELGKPIRLNSYGFLQVIAAEGIKISTLDIPIDNGYINELDGVMIPPEGNIMDIIFGTSNMQRMNTVVESTGLDNTFQNDMNITVFIPSDDAFAKVDDKIMNYLLAHPDDMIDVLLYHVVTVRTVYSIGMMHTVTYSTAGHGHAMIMIFEDDANNLYVNDAKIMERDISADNGVVHLIDKVLIPAKVLLKIEDQGVTVG